ncbi:MAG: FemAB family XrtA/PEP-CTERM system-associated protein [bacterium]
MDSNRGDLWDHFVEQQPQSTMYHLFGWKAVLEKTFGFKSYYLAACGQDGDISGILPLFLMRDLLQKKYLVSNPFANFAGLCTNDALSGEKLLQAAFEIARAENAQYIEFRQLREPIKAALTENPLPTKESFVTLMLDLEAGPEEIWKSLSSRNRGKVRKAEKAGLQVEVGPEYLADFYSVLSLNLKHLGTPDHPVAFYRAIMDEFGDRANLFVLKLNSEVVSAMFLFKFKNILAEPWVASLRKYNRIYVNNFLYWKAIEYACENGFEVFDFGRSTVAAGTFNFKVQWGAKPVQLYYHYFLNRAKSIPVVDAVNNQYEMYINIWKKLPFKLTQFVGPRLIKYVPQL